jgi:hypothetical protein
MSESWFEFNLQEKNFFSKMMFLWLPPVLMSILACFLLGIFTGSSQIGLIMSVFICMGAVSLVILFFLLLKSGGYFFAILRISMNPSLMVIEKVYRDKKSKLFFFDYKPPMQNPNDSINFEQDKIMTNQVFNERAMVRDLAFKTDKIYMVEGSKENVDMLKESPVDPHQKDICSLIKVCFDAGVDSASYLDQRTNNLLIIIAVILGLIGIANLILAFTSAGTISDISSVVNGINAQMPIDVNNIITSFKTNVVVLK